MSKLSSGANRAWPERQRGVSGAEGGAGQRDTGDFDEPVTPRSRLRWSALESRLAGDKLTAFNMPEADVACHWQQSLRRLVRGGAGRAESA